MIGARKLRSLCLTFNLLSLFKVISMCGVGIIFVSMYSGKYPQVQVTGGDRVQGSWVPYLDSLDKKGMFIAYVEVQLALN